MRQAFIKIFLIVFVVCILQGCIDAAVTGAQIAYNHDHLQKSFSDQSITTQAYRMVNKDKAKFDDSNIAITTFHKNLLITGQIPSRDKKNQVSELMENIPDVNKFYNLTEVTTPSTPLTRISDSWITGKIKAKLIAMNDIDPSQIKVVTENGTVFLMGMVLTDQAAIAVDIARTTTGVQNVVKLFTYLRISNS